MSKDRLYLESIRECLERIEEYAAADETHARRANPSGELFFWEPDEAGAFAAPLRAYGAVKGKKKLPWRYRWPEAVRDDVLARLLALNAERYGEEVALGLHSKGGKQAAKASKRRGRPAKASQVGETGGDHSEQMGLGL